MQAVFYRVALPIITRIWAAVSHTVIARYRRRHSSSIEAARHPGFSVMRFVLNATTGNRKRLVRRRRASHHVGHRNRRRMILNGRWARSTPRNPCADLPGSLNEACYTPIDSTTVSRPEEVRA